MALIGLLYLLVVVVWVKIVKAKQIHPYYLSHVVVIDAGFFGVALLGRFLTLVPHDSVESIASVIVAALCFEVMYWGLRIFSGIWASKGLR